MVQRNKQQAAIRDRKGRGGVKTTRKEGGAESARGRVLCVVEVYGCWIEHTSGGSVSGLSSDGSRHDDDDDDGVEESRVAEGKGRVEGCVCVCVYVYGYVYV